MIPERIGDTIIPRLQAASVILMRDAIPIVRPSCPVITSPPGNAAPFAMPMRILSKRIITNPSTNGIPNTVIPDAKVPKITRCFGLTRSARVPQARWRNAIRKMLAPKITPTCEPVNLSCRARIGKNV